MRARAARLLVLIVAAALFQAACTSPPPAPSAPLLAPTEEQMKIRNMQTRRRSRIWDSSSSGRTSRSGS